MCKYSNGMVYECPHLMSNICEPSNCEYLIERRELNSKKKQKTRKRREHCTYDY